MDTCVIEKNTYCVNRMKKKRVEARCGCGPLALVQGALQCGLRLVRQGSLIPLYTFLSAAFSRPSSIFFFNCGIL